MDALWWIVIGASLVVWGIKVAGYLLPQRLAEGPLLSKIAALVTVALLASLVVSQTFGANGGVTVDARLPAVLVAAALLWVRAPFIAVIVAAAAVAALIRAVGWLS